MAQAYRYLARWFERLNDDCGYEQWSQYFVKGLQALGAGKQGLEVGCGSGAFSRLAAEAGVRVRFVQADAASLALGKFDFLLSPNDCYNYIPPERLPAAFRHAASSLKKGGIFWFDLSSEQKLRKKIGDNVFADDRDEVTYLVLNHLCSDRVVMDVTLFVRRDDGAFDRFDEQHTQYIHPTARVREMLCSAGFEVLRTEGHLGEAEEGSDRVNFICRKL